MNTKLLRRVERHILKEPKRYEQNAVIDVGTPNTESEFNRRYPACGTIACIGGWITVLTTKKPLKPGTHYLRFRKMARLLRVTEEQVIRLCEYTWGTGWPEQFLKAYKKAKTPRQKAKVAVRRIEHFIATKGE